MIINKITTGYVVQSFDTETRKFLGQDFIASNEVNYETENGEPADEELFEKDGKEIYLPYNMEQPE